MKKVLHTLIFILILSVALGLSVFAADPVTTTYVDGNEISWNVTLKPYDAPVADGDMSVAGSATINKVELVAPTRGGFIMPTYIEYDNATYVVTEIANNAFKDNSFVFGKLTLPEKLERIGDSAFQKSRIYSDIVIPDSVTYIGSSAFREVYGLLSINIPSGISEIYGSTFYDCRSLVAVYADENLKYIRASAFYNCYALYEIPIGMGTLEINGSAFENCKALEFTLNLTSLIKLENNAFKNCINITKIILPNALTFNLAPFSGCTKIKEYVANKEALYVSTDSGVLYDKNKTVIYKYPSPKKDTRFVIPSTVTTIYQDAFYGASELYEIVLPENITSIGANAFRGTSVTTFFIPDTVTTLGTYALADCPNLEWVVVGSKIGSASSIVSNSKKVKYVIGRHPTFTTSGSGVSSPGVCVRANDFVCTTHFYGYLGTPATCTESGVNICAACNDEVFAKPLGHIGLIKEQSSLTCTTDEYTIIDCTRCGDHNAKTIYEYCKGHTPAGKPVVQKPSVTSLGYTITTCSVCEQTEITDYICSFYLVGDVNGDGSINQSDVDYLAKYLGGVSLGVNKLSCDINNDKAINLQDLMLLKRFVASIDEIIAPSNQKCEKHLHVKTDTPTRSNCISDGITITYCFDCGTVIETKIEPKTGHDFEILRKIEPTCQSTGFEKVRCKTEGCNLETEISLSYADHTGNWWTLPGKKGYEYRECDKCGAFEGRVVDYSEYDTLMAQISKNYKLYYTKESLSLVNPLIENYSCALTQEQVDKNVDEFKKVLPRIQYNVSDVPVVFITTDGSHSMVRNMPYIGAEIVVAYFDEGGIYHDYVEHDGQARVRGNSTADQGKKPYNIKFSTDVDLFGMGKDNKYCLLANALDTTMMRNALMMYLNQALGLQYSCKFEFVDVYCDGKYNGAYLMTTPTDIEENRIEINEESDILLEVEASFTEAGCIYTNSIDTIFDFRCLVENTAELNGEGYRNLYSVLTQIEYAIYGQDWQELQKYMDVDSIARYYILHEYLKDIDITWDSTRFYIQDGKLKGGPAWDFDFALGNAGVKFNNNSAANLETFDPTIHKDSDLKYMGGTDNSRDAYANIHNFGNGTFLDSTTGTWANTWWIGRITDLDTLTWEGSKSHHTWFTALYYYSPEFMELVSKRIWDLRDEMQILYKDVYDSLGNVSTNIIDTFYNDQGFYNSVLRNYSTAGHSVTAERSYISFKSYKEAVEHLRDWLEDRHNWMLEYYCSDYIALDELQAASDNAKETVNDAKNNTYFRTTEIESVIEDANLTFTVNITVDRSELAKVLAHHAALYALVAEDFEGYSNVTVVFNYIFEDSTGALTFVNGKAQ